MILGKILKPQGIKGELKYKPHIEDDRLTSTLKVCYVDGKRREILSNTIRFGYGYISLSDVTTRNDAEKLRGRQIMFEREDVQICFEEGQFLIADMIGCKIVDEDFADCGTLFDVLQYGAADVLVIEQNGKTYQIPYITSVVKSVDHKNKKIIICKHEFDLLKI